MRLYYIMMGSYLRTPISIWPGFQNTTGLPQWVCLPAKRRISASIKKAGLYLTNIPSRRWKVFFTMRLNERSKSCRTSSLFCVTCTCSLGSTESTSSLISPDLYNVRTIFGGLVLNTLKRFYPTGTYVWSKGLLKLDS